MVLLSPLVSLSLRAYGPLFVLCSLVLLLSACASPRLQRNVSLPATANGAELQGVAVELHTRRVVDLDSLVRLLLHAQVIALGEEHYHPDIQAFELHLLRALVQQRPRHLALAMEFLERDEQQAVDAYLAGTIDQATFHQRIEASSSFQRYYSPLIDFAQQARLPIIAMNVPRRLARQVAKEGWQKTLQGLDAAERVYLPATLPTVSAHYRTYFLDAVAAHHPVQGEQAERLTESALLKDVTMADSLAAFLDHHPDFTVLAIAGRFHMDYGIALPSLLRQQRQQVVMQRLTTMSVAADSRIDLRHLREEDIADYIRFFPPAPTQHDKAVGHLDLTTVP
jgi:uncharacterized iron-regulated protein